MHLKIRSLKNIFGTFNSWDLKRYLYILVFLLFIFEKQFVFAYTTNATTAAGNWSTAGIWSQGHVPTSSEFVQIKHNTIISTAAVCKGIDVQSLKTLTINSGASLTASCQATCCIYESIYVSGTINCAGTLVGTGSYSSNNGVTVNSSGTINITSPGSFSFKGPLGGTGTVNMNAQTMTIGTGGNVVSGIKINSTGIINLNGGTSHNFDAANCTTDQATLIVDGENVYHAYGSNVYFKKIILGSSFSYQNSIFNYCNNLCVYDLDASNNGNNSIDCGSSSSKTLTIEGSVINVSGKSGNYTCSDNKGLFRGSGTVRFYSGLHSFSGWTKLATQTVPNYGGGYAIQYPNLIIVANSNTVNIGTNNTPDVNYLDVAFRLEMYSVNSTNSFITTTLPSSSYIKARGDVYIGRDYLNGNTNTLTLNLKHKIEYNGTGGNWYMGNNSAHIIYVYWENATVPVMNNFIYATAYGTVNYIGPNSTDQIAINASYYNLNVNRTHTSGSDYIVALFSNIAVRNELKMTKGDLDVRGYNIDLETTGFVNSESNTNRIFCSGCSAGATDGKILSQGTNLAASTDYTNIRGMGIGITTYANAPGSTDINRGFRIRSGGELNTSVKRYFEITPTNNTTLGATLTFHYWDLESNGLSISEVALYRDNTGSDGWVKRGGSYAAPVPGDNTVTLPGIDEFSPWTVGKNNEPVPVRLLFFDATCDKNKIVLNWSTASETNCNNFIIEKSYDTKTWTSIGSLAGAGNSNHLNNYSFSDDEPFEKTVYYRLKQVDYDGAFDIYGPVAAGCAENNDNMEIQVYPNPTDEKVYIQAAIDRPGNILLTDITGRTITEYQQHILSVPLEVSLESVPPGIYMIRVVTEGFSNNYKIVRK